MVCSAPAAVIRAYRAEDDDAVRELYARCHPTWPARSAHWFTMHPTLLAVVEDELLGFTQVTIGVATGLKMLHGVDLCVAPAAQGAGLGRLLHEYRLTRGQSVGATMFAGYTQPENTTMRRIFESAGHHACQTVRGYFPDGQDGVLYLGAIEG